MNDNKTQVKGDGICLVSRGGKGATGVFLPMFPCGSSLVARLYLVKNEAPEEEAAMAWCKLHHP